MQDRSSCHIKQSEKIKILTEQEAVSRSNSTSKPWNIVSCEQMFL